MILVVSLKCRSSSMKSVENIESDTLYRRLDPRLAHRKRTIQQSLT